MTDLLEAFRASFAFVDVPVCARTLCAGRDMIGHFRHNRWVGETFHVETPSVPPSVSKPAILDDNDRGTVLQQRM